jgi:hypothetical protein
MRFALLAENAGHRHARGKLRATAPKFPSVQEVGLSSTPIS